MFLFLFNSAVIFKLVNEDEGIPDPEPVLCIPSPLFKVMMQMLKGTRESRRMIGIVIIMMYGTVLAFISFATAPLFLGYRSLSTVLLTSLFIDCIAFVLLCVNYFVDGCVTAALRIPSDQHTYLEQCNHWFGSTDVESSDSLDPAVEFCLPRCLCGCCGFMGASLVRFINSRCNSALVINLSSTATTKAVNVFSVTRRSKNTEANAKKDDNVLPAGNVEEKDGAV